MKYPNNISSITPFQPDMMGFIFYPKSKRYVGDDFSFSAVQSIPNIIQKVGVFVNETNDAILEKFSRNHLELVQLHGDETPSQCQFLQQQNIPVIKAFQIDEAFNFDTLFSYQPFCNYFLFDTKTEQYGGSGHSFNWKILNNYTLPTPFFLSGGIGLQNIDEALQITHPMLYAFDMNSKLETEPGVKSIEACKTIIQKIRNHESV